MDGTAVIAIVTVLGSAVAGLIWVIQFLFSKLLPAIEDLQGMVANGNELTKANTSATKSADRYLRGRNGRDAKQHAELVKATQAIPITMRKIADEQADALKKALTDLPAQHVGAQNVDKQTVGQQD